MIKNITIISVLVITLIGVGLFVTHDASPLAGISKVTVEAEMEKTKSGDGDYVQILKDGTVDGGKTFDKTKLPPNTWVNVYDGSKGKGYQIVTEYDDRTEYTGYGVHASDFTYIYMKPQIIATST